MDPFRELSRWMRLYRTHILIEPALNAYGLNDARLLFLQYTADIIYLVDLPMPAMFQSYPCVVSVIRGAGALHRRG